MTANIYGSFPVGWFPQGPEVVKRELELRDYFAGQALVAIAVSGVSNITGAEMAYNYAEAMLHERQRRDIEAARAAMPVSVVTAKATGEAND